MMMQRGVQRRARLVTVCVCSEGDSPPERENGSGEHTNKRVKNQAEEYISNGEGSNKLGCDEEMKVGPCILKRRERVGLGMTLREILKQGDKQRCRIRARIETHQEWDDDN